MLKKRKISKDKSTEVINYVNFGENRKKFRKMFPFMERDLRNV